MSNTNDKKSVKHHRFFSIRFLFLIIILVLQILVISGIYKFFSNHLIHYLGSGMVLAFLMQLYLVHIPMDGGSKTSWMILIIISPIFGSLFYWFVSMDFGHKVMAKIVGNLIEQSKDLIKYDSFVDDNKLDNYLKLSNEIHKYENTRIKYFSLGEYKWIEMLKQLEKAKDFIFLEYFIIADGKMWSSILDILKRKAKEGLDVRVMYDGTCEFSTLPFNYADQLEAFNIKAKAFAPIKPFVSTHYNYRDHRKILVIDGKVAFNGGVNLADEYVNEISIYGHWKDTAIMIEGDAVKKFTLMFLQMWYVDLRELNIKEEFLPYLNVEAEKFEVDGYVMPYGDNPLDDYKVGEKVYIEILNTAKEYVHIMSPYLILDEEMTMALKFAAEKGIDVKIILPGIPDKKTPYALAKTHYSTLVKSGVKIYEYIPGYIHAKSFVSDDDTAVVGTINLDYRSFYHHFECATYLRNVDAIKDIENDFQDTLLKCRQVTRETIKNESFGMKMLGYIAKVLAPLM